MTTAHAVFVRYGAMPRVGRFRVEGEAPRRGDRVVVRSPRGTELGEVLAAASPGDVPAGGLPPLLRGAGPEDLERERLLRDGRDALFGELDRVFRDGRWPIVPIDAEPLLDEGRAVLYYLGPHGLDDEGLREALRRSVGLEVLLEPAGRDEADPDDHPGDPSSCGEGCGSGGGCGAGGGCHPAGSGCSGCSLKTMLADRRRSATPAASIAR